jgi:DNA-binding transcriptional ArsR family regulator
MPSPPLPGRQPPIGAFVGVHATNMGAWRRPGHPICYGRGRSIGGGNPARPAAYFCDEDHNMSTANQMAEVAALVGDPTRANILVALLDGRALTASELAYAAHVSPQTASGHLGKLEGAKLLEVVKQGRHRYFRLAGAHVGQMLEGIMNVAIVGPPRHQPRSRLDDQLRNARTCYDHLAGRLGVGLAEQLIAHEHVILGHEAGEVTEAGEQFMVEIGVDLSQARSRRRIFCRPCVDWTERRPHIGGAVGAALADRMFALHWIERVRDSRAVAITPAGRHALQDRFGLTL